jgi:LAO/AO transport system kinase
MTIDYAGEILQGSPRAVARVISWLENENELARPCMESLYPHTGKAYVVGITGSPGTGKSTLTDKLTRRIREKGLTVGIIAVDPSSPFTGGAVLGDRIRMSEIAQDPVVFIRSMATRGFLGGLSQSTGKVVNVLDAAGKDVIIIETVGVGQDEVEIMRIADTTCLVLAPGLGDAIQSMKAGVMEIADVYVINKSDRQGADQLFVEVSHRVSQDDLIKAKSRDRSWIPSVVQASAVNDVGVTDVMDAVLSHQSHLKKDGTFMEKRRERTRQQTLQMIHYEIFSLLRKHLSESGKMEQLVDAIMNHERDPYSVVQQVLSEWIKVPEG